MIDNVTLRSFFRILSPFKNKRLPLMIVNPREQNHNPCLALDQETLINGKPISTQ